MRALLLPLTLLLCAPALASGSYHDEGSVAPGTSTLGGDQTYSVQVEEGQRLVALVAGPEEGFGLHVSLQRLCAQTLAQAQCGRVAITGPDSFVGGGVCGVAQARGTGTLRIEHVAARAERLFVEIAPVAATEPVPYAITLSVDGAAPAIVGRGGAPLSADEDAAACEARAALAG